MRPSRGRRRDAVDVEVVEEAGDVVDDEGEGVVLDAVGFAAVDLVASHGRSVRETVQQ